MAVQLNTATFPQFTDLVERMFSEGLEKFKSPLRESGMIKEMQIPEGTGQFRRIAEMPDQEQYASIKDEGDAAEIAQVQYGYEVDLQVKRYAKDITITVEERKQGKNQDVIAKLTDLSTVVPARLELDLAHRIGFGASTSYTDKDGQTVTTTVGDGLALFSTAHTLTGSATTYRNTLSGNPVFSKGSMEAIERQAVENSYNNLGEKIPMEFDIIWCTDDPNTNNAIDELLNATADVVTSNSGTFNVYRSGGRRKVASPHIATTATGATDTTKRRYWGIASSRNSSFYLGVLESPFLKVPAAGNNGEDFSTENWTYGARGSYGIAICSGRFIHASLPTS